MELKVVDVQSIHDDRYEKWGADVNIAKLLVQIHIIIIINA